MPEDLTVVGRTDLIALIAELERERKTYADNLSATQTRCTELLDETRAQRRKLAKLEALSGLLLAGWFCPQCNLFNGEEKLRHVMCRGCDAPRPANPGIVTSRPDEK